MLDTAGFVISNYLLRASQTEAAAALALSKQLEGFAGTVGRKTEVAKEEGASEADTPRLTKKRSRPGGRNKADKGGISS